MAPATGKRLKIKAFKEKPRLPADFLPTTWRKLQMAVRAVFAAREVEYSFEELYRAAEDLCLHKYADYVYSGLQQECGTHIKARLGELSRLTADPFAFLAQLEQEWQTYCNQLITVRGICLYLDRTHVLSSQDVAEKSIFDMGLGLFRAQVEATASVKRTLFEGLVAMVQMVRSNQHVDRKVLKSLVRMVSMLGLYSTLFEPAFLAATQQFYEEEGRRVLASTQVPGYLSHCERRLAEEEEMCAALLDRQRTHAPLMKIVEEQLLRRHLTVIHDKGFAPLMDQTATNDLARLYDLCGRVGELDTTRVVLGSYVKQRAGDCVMDEGNDGKMVQSLLDLKQRIDAVLAGCFRDNESFASCVKEALETSINMRQNRPAELVAKFIDAKLRTGNKGDEEELESVLDRVLVIFRCISGKDVFEAFYKKDLAKRLLLGRSASIDAEKSTIGKLKTECGSQFTNKLEGMFKDIDISRDIMQGFKQSQGVRKKLSHGIELSVNVLTTGYWPTYPVLAANLPQPLVDYQDVFRDYYMSKHSGRRLTWQNSLGQCMVKCKFAKGTKELAVSLFQTVVLMLFNEADVLTYAEIEKATGIEPRELKRTLQSLSLGKVRVLTKEPKVKEVEPEHTFAFNDKFTAPLYRLKVNNIQLKETREENASTTEKVFQDRQYQVDAAIVRIMKSRKTLSHTLLMSELYSQLKFPIKPSDLKKRIESLIDREYLERDGANPQVYNYLA